MRILFFHRGGCSGSVDPLVRTWQSQQPQVRLSSFDLQAAIFEGPLSKLRTLPRAVWRGGLRTLTGGDGSFLDAVKHSLWMSRRMSRFAAEIHRRQEADISFAMGTTYDASFDGRPHFIYTDLTILANLYYPDGEESVRRWQKWLPYETEALNRAERVFTHSSHVTRSLLEQYRLPAEKVVCVKAGANVKTHKDPYPQRYEQKNVLFVGFDWERKGGPQLVEAFTRVRRCLPEATLTIIGCKPRISGPGIRVVGPVSQDQVADYLSRAMVFCMPSLREPFGFVYLEALQAGLPVIAANLGAVPDFVIDGQTGYTVPPYDIDALAARMEELLCDPDKCRQMGNRGQELIAAEYTWEQTHRRIAQAIHEALQKDR